jgi:poly-gamma-glutamate capsule biosynthesis protein CapA/YwtB (metallophosphatase superfamily)
MLSRNVAGTIQKANDPLLPFKNMEEILKSTDFNFGNLESPISGKDHFNPSGSLVFNAPTAYTVGLKEYNFSILSLANNHALDQGAEGLEYTINFLDQQNIQHVGVGMNLDDAWNAEIVTANGIKIGFIGASYASINDNGKTTNSYVARIEDVENLKLKIENLKSIADFIVVTMHAGTEYVTKPNQGQVDFAQNAIDFGADLVIGHHAHWVQTIEYYKGKYIFYGLGNFIFDQEWSRETKEGLTLKIQISKSQVPTLQGPKVSAKLDSIELIPVVIENYSTPRPATFEESQKILQRIGQIGTLIK